MTKKNILFIFILMCSSILLLVSVMTFDKRQQELFFESNDLYTQNHVFVNDKIQRIFNQTFQDVSDLSVFLPLESKNDDQVRAYTSKDYRKQQFPISEGHFFKKTDSKEAVIGRKVETLKKNNIDYYSYGDNTYKVIGYLGTTTPSFLDQSVLINDLKLMKTTDKAFFAVDGSQITEKHHLQYAKADRYQNNVGLDRKINSDFFSPLLVYFSTVIIFLCNVLIAYTLSQDLSQQNKVTYLLGNTTIKRLLNNSSYLLTIYLVAASIALGLSQWLIISQGTLFANLKVIGWQLLVIMVVFLVFFVRGEKELHHGMDL